MRPRIPFEWEVRQAKRRERIRRMWMGLVAIALGVLIAQLFSLL